LVFLGALGGLGGEKKGSRADTAAPPECSHYYRK